MRKLASNTLQHTIKHALFLPVGLADGGQAGEDLLARDHGLAEDHEEPANDGEVAEEEVEVEDESRAVGVVSARVKTTCVARRVGAVAGALMMCISPLSLSIQSSSSSGLSGVSRGCGRRRERPSGPCMAPGT